ncbi:MAG: MmcQ/YjbR family DNA-binding protein [Dehalococcoidia bacterium]
MSEDHFQRVVHLANFPGVEVGTSYGTPALKVKKKLLARMKEDGETVVIPTSSIDEKEFLIATEPEVYFQTDHYRAWPHVLVRLPIVTDSRLREMLEAAWRREAPAKLLKEYEGDPG